MKYLYIAFLALCLAACGSDDSFMVVAKVDGLGTQNVRAVYRSGNRVNVVPAMALDGSFRLTGSAREPVLIDIYTSSRALLGSLVACNGDNIEVSYKLNEPGFMTAKGNDITEGIAAFVTANAEAINSGDREALNRSIEKRAGAKREDAALPYIFLMMYDPVADPAKADSLMTAIGGDVLQGELGAAYRGTLALECDTLKRFPVLRLFTAGDSLTTVSAGSSRGVLLAIPGNDDSVPYDSVLKSLNEAGDSLKKKARVVELATVVDTADWHAMVRDLKPRYTRCWTPGGVSSPALLGIAVPRLPWYVAADSTSQVVYAGNDLSRAVSSLK